MLKIQGLEEFYGWIVNDKIRKTGERDTCPKADSLRSLAIRFTRHVKVTLATGLLA